MTPPPTPSSSIEPGEYMRKESIETTHYSIADQYGNIISNTYTLNSSYGSGVTIEGTGILMNNEMDDFSASPGTPNQFGLLGGEANKIVPEKRPLSSMTPTIILKDGIPYFATGRTTIFVTSAFFSSPIKRFSSAISTFASQCSNP